MGYTKDFNNIELTTINIPGSVGTYNVNTLPDALKYVGNKYIRPGTTVTINIAAGTYTFTSPIVFNYEFGSNIQIVGNNTYKTVIAYTAKSGSTGAWSVTYTFNNVTGLTVGTYISVDTLQGTNTCPHLGTWKITAISGNSVTILNTFRGTFPTTSQSSLTAGNIVVYNTVFNFNNCDGITIAKDTTLAALDQIILVGNNTGYNGLIAATNSFIYCGEVSAVGFNNGFMATNGGQIQSYSIGSCSNVNGVYCGNRGSFDIPYANINGNSIYGVYNQSFSTVAVQYAAVVGNGTTDVLSQDKSLSYVQSYCCSSCGGGSYGPTIIPALMTVGNNGSVNLGAGSCTYIIQTGSYNVGNNNTGLSCVGNNNTGQYCNGNNNTGKYDNGNNQTADNTTAVITNGVNQGSGNTGVGNVGNNNNGNYNVGNNNVGDHNVGNSNNGNYNIGNNNSGSNNFGNNNSGSGNFGNNNAGNNNKGQNISGNNINNIGTGNLGQHNIGVGNIGNNNVGNWNIGNNNNGTYNIGNNNGTGGGNSNC